MPTQGNNQYNGFPAPNSRDIKWIVEALSPQRPAKIASTDRPLGSSEPNGRCRVQGFGVFGERTGQTP